MKKMRKIAGVLLALVMVFALAAPAFAAEAETYSITINNDATGHTYEAYQIFKGDLNGHTLSNVQWGDSVTNASSLPSAASVAERLDENYEGTDPLTIDQLLAMITLGEEVASTSTQTNGKYVIDGLAPGYYLIKDLDDSLTGKDDAYTEYMVKVVKNIETTPKSDVPEFEKKVDDKNDSNTTQDEIEWEDSADHDIGDDVPFQLKATLANNVESYSSYKVVFHDTMSAGLTFNADSVKVYVDGKLVTTGYTVNTDCTDGCTFEVIINDAKAIGATNSSIITVEYTAELNENAVLGSTGNPNVAYLEYSNNPNWEGDGDNQPGEPEDDEPTGKTPEDKVIVFTYKVIVNKVDENKNPLAGAGFTLYKLNAESGEYEQIGEELFGDQMTQFVWEGLDDGDYKLEETTTPAGYNTIEPIYFTITAEHEVLSDDPRLTSLNGGDLFTGEVSTGTVAADVENKSGVELPETGGMGTTIFYTMGAMMALGAAILLITKKRMGIAE